MAVTDIKNLTLEELEKELAGIGARPFSAKQIFEWMYRKSVFDFDHMTNLSKDIRAHIKSAHTAALDRCEKKIPSSDKTVKYLYRLDDSRFIESVHIRAGDRDTLCVSSQVGCRFRCAFCASGMKGFIRNLSAAEILNQVLYLKTAENRKITNYVFMGMGEPLDNYDNVLRAIGLMNSPDALNIGIRNITLSTCGLVPGIKKLMDSGIKVNLSVSLHAARDDLRNRLVPVNRKYPLAALYESCSDYFKKTGRLVTLEYVLLENVNDAPKDAYALARASKKINAKINLILYNPVKGLSFGRPSSSRASVFISKIRETGAKVTLRESRGSEIMAACGQLCLAGTK